MVLVRLQEYQNVVVRGEIEKSGMADHIWKEMRNHLLSWDNVKIVDGENTGKEDVSK